MKASELRIGNLVAYEPTIDDWEEIIVKCGNIIQCEISPDSFIPIPLTEEWLLKFGGILNEENDSYGFGKFYVSVNEESEALMFFKDEEITEFKYVHQLQNIYFALTNEELTFKSLR